jgi:hypothetical protein
MTVYRILKETAPGKFTPTGETLDTATAPTPIPDEPAQADVNASKVEAMLAEKKEADGACYAVEEVAK